MTPMEKARSKLLLGHMFYATLVLSTPFRENKNCPTAQTDYRSVEYNPEFIASLPVDVVMFVIVHEIMHIMLKHNTRRGTRHPIGWNIAADFAINLILKKGDFKLWDKCCVDERFDGMTAEQIYEILKKEAEERDKKKKSKGKGDEDNPFGDVGGLGADIIEPKDLDPTEIEQIEREINQKVAQATAAARIAGQMPAGLDLIVDGILNPPLPWQTYLREYMMRIVQDDESWSRRNRRYSRWVLPSRYSEGMGEVVVIGDTSGSMLMDHVFAQIAEELNCIISTTRPERVRVIWADDAECALEEIFEPGEEVKLNPKGGGGTDMRKPLLFVEKYQPDVVILITDGYTPWPAEVSYPLIVACTTNQPVPIGSVVRLNIGSQG